MSIAFKANENRSIRTKRMHMLQTNINLIFAKKLIVCAVNYLYVSAQCKWYDLSRGS